MRDGFGKLAQSEVRIRKPIGTLSSPHKCVLTNEAATFFGQKVDIDEGDELVRTLPTGKEEVFSVVDVQYQPSVGSLPAHYTAKLRKGARPPTVGVAPITEGGQARAITVFVSWSGERSHFVALALKEWLPQVLPGVTAWVSSEDIAKGARWSPEIAKQLGAAAFGVVCLVAENVGEAWVLFESGALSNSVDGRVAPFLLGVAIGDVPGPLRQFQCTHAEKADVLRLARSISMVQNRASSAPPSVDQLCEQHWPKLEAALASIARRPSARRDGGAASRRQDSTAEASSDGAHDRTMALAREWSGSGMVAAREALAAWMRTKTRAVNIAGALLDLPRQTEQVRQLVEFISQAGVLGRSGLLDLPLAKAMFGTEMIRTCSDLETGPKTALTELWPDWFARVQPAIEATRMILQSSTAPEAE